MKIICVDNYDRESFSDVLVCENIHRRTGEAVVDFLNNRFGGGATSCFYRLVEDDHKLYKFIP